ncbi:metalloregulator ArsR/SmtB family transcription factor [Shewanella sp. NIFS-20-20]|uniref:helix-turn-helix transcriptional regulator n=1 Tax=Shewanella sp. NIFS-20-20 TaxID=2853806 RepID=UPI001C46BAF2|nr:metalloregulator ArsR/SmtB family transcription factor [Shewanella sp. NIFS-20-20]MBV7314456.1 transcriptional regulator [Shewanella sp. NIFS-20-20]
MKTTDKILSLLKTKGAMTAQQLADSLQLTSMGARQHLQQLTRDGLVDYIDEASGRGRPRRLWQLTANSQGHFPDSHQVLTVQMLDSIDVVFGEQGLEQLISHREQQTAKQYQQALASAKTLAERLTCLVALRNREGYMAELQHHEQGYLLLENHCPICAAARRCQQFCRSELALFQHLLGPQVAVERGEHILEGARRCAYHIREITNDAM